MYTYQGAKGRKPKGVQYLPGTYALVSARKCPQQDTS